MRFSTKTLSSIALSTFLSSSRFQAWAQTGISPTKCGEVFNSTAPVLYAVDAYECLISTPFNRTLATQLVTYWRDNFKFQSTLAYLKDPPPGYQQNSVDLLGGFDLIQNQIDNGVYTNQYSFESSVHSLLQRSHDFHVYIYGGVMDAFAFSPEMDFTSVSLDGLSLPKVYDAYELLLFQNGTNSTMPPAITKVNGEIAEKFFANYGSRNSYGSIEPHGDYNQIMWSYAAAIQGYDDPFATPFYSGANLTIEYADGKTSEIPWTAIYIGEQDIPLINTGQDFFDWFVLGQDTPSDIAAYGGPAATSTVDSAATATDDEAPQLTSVSTASPTAATFTYSGWGGAYPDNPDVVQDMLGEGGYVTGYFLNDTKIGVLSIPSFALTYEDSSNVTSFAAAVEEFLQRSKAAGMTRILIDLQQNYGGDQFLARNTFKQFFPDGDPFEGQRTRSFDLSDQLGTIMTNRYNQIQNAGNDTLLAEFTNDPWAVTNEINAGTNQNFSSWAEYFGPHPDHDDDFSTVFHYDFLNANVEYYAGGIDTTDESLKSKTALYDAKDIVILTDSICASTCDLFVEMMHHEAGVRTVVVGGLPQVGPMQARGSTRGALALSDIILNANLLYAAAIDDSILPAFYSRPDSIAAITAMTFNFADQIRAKEYFPLQFAYEAADCRIFYTTDTYFDYEKLWNYAASAIFFNASTCVAHSAEHNNTMQTDEYGPSAEQLAAWAATNPANAPPAGPPEVVVPSSEDIAFYAGFNEDHAVYRFVNGVEYCFGTDCPQSFKRRAPTNGGGGQPLSSEFSRGSSQLGGNQRTASGNSRTSGGTSPNGALRGVGTVSRGGIRKKRSLPARRRAF